MYRNLKGWGKSATEVVQPPFFGFTGCCFSSFRSRLISHEADWREQITFLVFLKVLYVPNFSFDHKLIDPTYFYWVAIRFRQKRADTTCAFVKNFYCTVSLHISSSVLQLLLFWLKMVSEESHIFLSVGLTRNSDTHLSALLWHFTSSSAAGLQVLLLPVAWLSRCCKLHSSWFALSMQKACVE